jgi:hypothetical protein
MVLLLAMSNSTPNAEGRTVKGRDTSVALNTLHPWIWNDSRLHAFCFSALHVTYDRSTEPK